jgi:hypothetical protein
LHVIYYATGHFAGSYIASSTPVRGEADDKQALVEVDSGSNRLQQAVDYLEEALSRLRHLAVEVCHLPFCMQAQRLTDKVDLELPLSLRALSELHARPLALLANRRLVLRQVSLLPFQL